MRLFPARFRVHNPVVIVKVPRRGAYGYEEDTMRGKFWHVVPQCYREIAALAMLDHRVDKFAPGRGDGVIVTEQALARLDA